MALAQGERHLGPEARADIGRRLKDLRLAAKLTLRDLSKKADIAVSYLSNLEAGASSQTLATQHKALKALGTDLETFFSSSRNASMEGFVFKREEMRLAADQARQYTFLLPRRKDVKAEMLDEYLMPGEQQPEFEVLECDIAGVVLSGLMELEVGNEKRLVRDGDAFYIRAGQEHRGRCISSEPTHLITAYVPPKY